MIKWVSNLRGRLTFQHGLELLVLNQRLRKDEGGNSTTTLETFSKSYSASETYHICSTGAGASQQNSIAVFSEQPRQTRARSDYFTSKVKVEKAKK